MVSDETANKQNWKGFTLTGFCPLLLNNGKSLMGWNITPLNFEMILDAGIPEFLGKEMDHLMEKIAEKLHVSPDMVQHWAVHPGGKKILDSVQRELQMTNKELRHSYNVLRDYGNMSSPTILFVLNEISTAILRQEIPYWHWDLVRASALKPLHWSAMVSFKQRSKQKELMDDPEIPAALLHKNLRELDMLNRHLGGHAISLAGIKELMSDRSKLYHIVDLGCGSGDVLKYIARWARANQFRVKLTGIDNNPQAIKYLEEQSAAFPEISGVVADYTRFLEKPQGLILYIVRCFVITWKTRR